MPNKPDTTGQPDCACSKCSLDKAWKLLDAQNFLVRQRRNRIYGLAMASTGSQSLSQHQNAFQGAIHNLQSHCHFEMEECFDPMLPRESLHSTRERELVNRALKAAREVSRKVSLLFTF